MFGEPGLGHTCVTVCGFRRYATQILLNQRRGHPKTRVPPARDPTAEGGCATRALQFAACRAVPHVTFASLAASLCRTGLVNGSELT